MPVPQEVKEALTTLNVPDVSLIEFIKYALEEDTKKDNSEFLAYISEDYSALVSFHKEPKPLKPWAEALNQYINTSDQEKTNWKETLTFYPFPLSEFNEATNLVAKEEFRL